MHVERFSVSVRTACDIQIVGRQWGREAQANMEETDRESLPNLTTVYHQEKVTWRSGVRSAMRAAILLPGKGPTILDDAPAR